MTRPMKRSMRTAMVLCILLPLSAALAGTAVADPGIRGGVGALGKGSLLSLLTTVGL